MDRRDFLTATTGAIAALGLAGCGRGSDEETSVRFAADPAPDGTPRILIAGGRLPDRIRRIHGRPHR